MKGNGYRNYLGPSKQIQPMFLEMRRKLSKINNDDIRLPFYYLFVFRRNTNRAGFFLKSMGARKRAGIGLSYRPTRLHRLAEFIPWSQFLGSINVYKYGLRITGSLGLELVWREKPEVWTEEIYEALRTEERGGRGGGSHQLILGQCCGQLKYSSMAVHISC